MSYKDVLDIKVNPNLPEDLAINKKEKNIPKDYFDVTIDDLATSKQYAIQFQWVFTDGTTSDWSPSYIVSTSGDAPKVPTGFTGSSQFASVLVSWDGTYDGANPEESFDGFKCINVYAGNSNTYSESTAKLAGVLTSDLVDNTITIPVDGTYVKYNLPVYIFASALNEAGVESSKALVETISGGAMRASDVDLGPGAVTIEKLQGSVLVYDNIKAGNLSATSFLRAGTSTKVGKTETANGARIEISSSTTNITSYPDPLDPNGAPITLTNPVLPGLTVYNTSSSPIFRADLQGNVSLGGYTPADIGQISSTASSASSTAGIANSRSQKFDTSGNINAGIVMNATGSIYSYKTSYIDTTTGWYIGWYNSNPVINIGSDTNYLKWTGSAIDIRGTISAGTNTNNVKLIYNSAISNMPSIEFTIPSYNGGKIYSSSGGYFVVQGHFATGNAFQVGEIQILPPANSSTNAVIQLSNSTPSSTAGLRNITVLNSTSTPTGGVDGDIVLGYA